MLPEEPRAALPGGARRTNLRLLAARPDRFEHHLVPLGRAGEAQLELATASEPLYFAHANISDEYALALPTGDPLLDAFPFRTFFSDTRSGEDVGRMNHSAGDLVLHPHGYLHWAGRLRPPFDPPVFPGERRTGVSLVYCAFHPHAVHPDRPLRLDRDDAGKRYGDSQVPLHLVSTLSGAPGVVARVAGTRLTLLDAPSHLSAPLGGYLVVIDSLPDEGHAPCDLVYLPPGGELELRGVRRALWFADERLPAEPPTPVWDAAPVAPFAPFEDAPAGSLPFPYGALTVTDAGRGLVSMRLGESAAEVPRYWLARFLFRLGLHDYRVGYLETYGGFFYDDRGGYRLGLRGGGELRLPLHELKPLVESLYRAVAPEGYVERLT